MYAEDVFLDARAVEHVEYLMRLADCKRIEKIERVAFSSEG
jgi:hypothetical protein